MCRATSRTSRPISRCAPSPAASASAFRSMNEAPLGVFDSGIGGLTVARALFERLPKESVIYFGDTARVPYGPKSPDTVRRYSGEILAYLIRSEEHTSELQSQFHLVCRLLLEKK